VRRIGHENLTDQKKKEKKVNRHTIPLGRILGIPIGLDYSWFLIFVLITWTMAVGYYPAEFKNWSVAQYWIVGALTAIMLFASVLLHERPPETGRSVACEGGWHNPKHEEAIG
jgi:hypothetical protein